MNQSNENGSEQNQGIPTTPSDQDWIKLGYEERRFSITFLNDTAKLLFALPSTLSTLYLGLLTGISVAASKKLDWFSLTPIAAWVIAGAFAMVALFPRLYEVDPDVASDIRRENIRSIKRKYCGLQASLIVFLLGLILATLRIFTFFNR